MDQRLDYTDDSQVNAQAWDDMDDNLDGNLFDTPGSNEEWYEGTAKCYS
jgi:hypothetical protein